MTFYKQFLKKSDTFPVAEQIYDQILSLPLYPTLTKREITRITKGITDFIYGLNAGD